MLSFHSSYSRELLRGKKINGLPAHTFSSALGLGDREDGDHSVLVLTIAFILLLVT